MANFAKDGNTIEVNGPIETRHIVAAKRILSNSFTDYRDHWNYPTNADRRKHKADTAAKRRQKQAARVLRANLAARRKRRARAVLEAKMERPVVIQMRTRVKNQSSRGSSSHA